MTRFHEAFIFLSPGADPARRTVRESELSRTVFVPVPDADAAATVAAELQADGLDLVELYGGLGPTAAAAVLQATGEQVPVGVMSVEDDGTARNRAIIFYAPGADPTKDRQVHEHAGGRMTIVAVPDPAVVPAVATGLADEGAERIEICGGLGAIPTAAAIAAIGDRARVSGIMFGFESLPGVADYRARFEAAVAA
jgi:hypothetical protein